MDLTATCSAGEFFCWGFGLRLPSIVENLTRTIESGDKGAALDLELDMNFVMQGNLLSVSFGPLIRCLYLKEKFNDRASSVGRTWLSLGAGLNFTFKIFGNILAGVRARLYFNHRTFRHGDRDWSPSMQFGFYLGYGLNAVTW